MGVVRTAWFHEDEYAQVELLPLDNHDHCLRQIRAIGRFAEAHQAPTGLGWTDCLVRPAAPTRLADLSLTAGRLAAVRGRHLDAFDSVESGTTPHTEPALERTHAFGPDQNWAVYFDHDQAGVVGTLWLMLDAGGSQATQPLQGV